MRLKMLHFWVLALALFGFGWNSLGLANTCEQQVTQFLYLETGSNEIVSRLAELRGLDGSNFQQATMKFRDWMHKKNYTDEVFHQAVKKIQILEREQTVQRVEALRAKKESTGQYEAFDYLIVGDGPHAALALTRIRIEHPGAKVLLVTSSNELGGTLMKVGDYSFLSSAETAQSSTNRFPDSPVRLLDVANHEGYVISRYIGDLTALNIFATTGTLMNHRVESIDIKSVNEGLVTLRSSHDRQSKEVVLKANAIVNVTGQGQAFYGIKDKASLETIWRVQREHQEKHGDNPLKAPLIEHYEGQAHRARAIRKLESGSLLDAYKGKKVLIIGRGGGGAFVADSLKGFGPGQIYGAKRNFDPDVQVVAGLNNLSWWGPGPQKAHEFRGGEVNRRYNHTIARPEIWNSISHSPAKVESLSITPDGRVQVVGVINEGGAIRTVVDTFDYVVFATGYAGTGIKWSWKGQEIKEEGPYMTAENPAWRDSSYGDYRVGRLITEDSPFFVQFGPSAGPRMVQEAEWRRTENQSWYSVNVTGPRTVDGVTELIRLMQE